MLLVISTLVTYLHVYVLVNDWVCKYFYYQSTFITDPTGAVSIVLVYVSEDYRENKL